jgi:uncharacterized membrane protein
MRVSVIFARSTGWVFLLLGVTGLFTHDLWGLIQFDRVHTVLHFIFGFIGIAVGHSKYTKPYAYIMGILLVILGISGFLFTQIMNIHLEIVENLIHLILGTWGVYIALGEVKPIQE